MGRLDRIGPIAAACALLIAGAVKYPSDYSNEFLAVGFVVLGAWLSVEIGHIVQHRLERKARLEDKKGE